MSTTTALLAAEDLYKLPFDLRCELIDGALIELSPPGARHGKVAARIAARLLSHVEAEQLGTVVVETGFILRRNPDTVRGPDVAFVRADRIAADGEPSGFWELAPDLVVEVVSPTDTASEIQLKVREWIESGARLVWTVYPESRTVNVARSLTDREVLAAGDTLHGGDVLPGFSCLASAIFD